MAGRKRRTNNRTAKEHIEYVKRMIERCLQSYMNRQEAEQYLETHFKIQPDITRTIWQRLEEENKDFFKWYNERYLVRNQVNQFNNLLHLQADMVKRMRVANQNLPQPTGFNTTENGNAQVMMPFPPLSEAPLQPDLYSGQFPQVPKLQLEASLQPQVSNLELEASLQPASNSQLEASLQPHLHAFALVNNPCVPDLLARHTDVIHPLDPRLSTLPQSGFHTSEDQQLATLLPSGFHPSENQQLATLMLSGFQPSEDQQLTTLLPSGLHPPEDQPRFATPIMAQNPAASALRADVDFPGLLRHDISSLMTPGISMQQIRHGLYAQEFSNLQQQQQLWGPQQQQRLLQPGVEPHHQPQQQLQQLQQRQPELQPQDESNANNSNSNHNIKSDQITNNGDSNNKNSMELGPILNNGNNNCNCNDNTKLDPPTNNGNSSNGNCNSNSGSSSGAK